LVLLTLHFFIWDFGMFLAHITKPNIITHHSFPPTPTPFFNRSYSSSNLAERSEQIPFLSCFWKEEEEKKNHCSNKTQHFNHKTNWIPMTGTKLLNLTATLSTTTGYQLEHQKY
jgi:hypothetical protein